MSQHVIDSGRRVSADRQEVHADRQEAHADRQEAHRDALREAGGQGDGRSQRETFGGYSNGAGTGRTGEGRTGEGHTQDVTLRALEALSDALAEMSNDRQLLEKRLRDLHRQRSEGRAWHDILAEEDGPGTMQIVSRMLACLAKASGTLRKELVDTLRREGVSIPSIAKLFGVTHQRVSNLLRRSAE